MKSLFKLIKVSTAVFLCLFIVIFSKSLVHAEDITNSKVGISPDKEWHINFTNNVNSDYVNSNYIYVNDSFGNPVALNLKVNPSNEKQVIVDPKDGKYVLGKTYILTISKDFLDENGNKMGKDYKMQFTIKSQLIDTADFKVENFAYKDGTIAIVSINSISDPNIKGYKVDGQDTDSTLGIGEKAYVSGNIDNVFVYFYDEGGNEIGSSLINIKKASDSQVVQINN